ncbi:MAG: hypothetical protein ACLVJ6_12615 [Merdibacter sp.]
MRSTASGLMGIKMAAIVVTMLPISSSPPAAWRQDRDRRREADAAPTSSPPSMADGGNKRR